MFKKSSPLFFICFLFISLISKAETLYDTNNKFRQLEEILPTPNDQRIASGAPGPKYWQQRAQYVIEATLDDNKQNK